MEALRRSLGQAPGAKAAANDAHKPAAKRPAAAKKKRA